MKELWMRLQSLSLKYKLMGLLVLFSVVTLSIFFALSMRLFVNDKQAYVFDALSALASSTAAQTATALGAVEQALRPIAINSDDSSTSQRLAKNIFADQRSILAFQIWKPRKNGNSYEKILDQNSPKSPRLNTQDGLQVSTRVEGPLLSLADESGTSLIYSFCVGDRKSLNHYVVVAKLDANFLLRSFDGSGLYTSFLLDKKFKKLLKTANTDFETLSNFADFEAFKDLQSSGFSNRVFVLNESSEAPLLAGLSNLGFGNLSILTVVEQSRTLTAIGILATKSSFLFLGLVFLCVLLSLVSSSSITSALSQLTIAVQRVGKGDFSVRVPTTAKNEVGVLAEGFNFMAEEVARLMKETIEKVRMEKELATAKTVQDTLFPNPDFESKNLKVSGFYEPASECGGDWWHYSEAFDKAYLYIGDATGHGAPAALMTSAAKAAAFVAQRSPNATPANILKVINDALFETTKGKLQMTFFMACLDYKTGKLSYCNASHEFPYLMSQGGEPRLLTENANPRLGESNTHNFSESILQLSVQDSLVFYTDGVFDIRNPSDKQFGERRFIKSLSEALKGSVDPKVVVKTVSTDIEAFRSKTNLNDDVTFFVCQYKKAA